MLTTTYKSNGGHLFWQASINWDNRHEETNPSNNHLTGRVVSGHEDVMARIRYVDVFRNGKWERLDKNNPVVYEGEEIRPTVEFRNIGSEDTSIRGSRDTSYQAEIWVGDGWGTGPLIEQLIWENNKSYYPTPHPSNNRTH